MAYFDFNGIGMSVVLLSCKCVWCGSFYFFYYSSYIITKIEDFNNLQRWGSYDLCYTSWLFIYHNRVGWVSRPRKWVGSGQPDISNSCIRAGTLFKLNACVLGPILPAEYVLILSSQTRSELGGDGFHFRAHVKYHLCWLVCSPWWWTIARSSLFGMTIETGKLLKK